MFFGSRWNILVSKPEYIAQIFKDENTFAKSGNQKKIPYSVIASYTGDNIISAHGTVWKTYRTIMSDGLQNFNEKPFYDNAKKFCQLLDKYSKKEELIGDQVLGFDFGTLEEEYNPLHQHLIRIKKQIFHPFFLTFPFFDLFPLPQRKKAFKDVKDFRTILVERVRKEMIDNYNFEQTNFVVNDLIKAYNNDIIDYEQLTDNIVILLVAGHENPQLLITSCLYLLAKYHDTWQYFIRKELDNLNELHELNDAPFLTSFVYETLRFFPPLNTIINRKTTRKCALGNGIIIPKDTYVGYNNFGTTHCYKHWGATADVFDPLRFGESIEDINKEWKYRKTVCSLSSFHGGRRACLGEKYALLGVKITIKEVLKTFYLKLHNNWEEKMTPAGPLCPFNLKLKFTKRHDIQKNK